MQAGESEQQPLQRVEACRAVRAQAALGGRLDDRAVRGVGKMGAAPRTLLGDLGELGERAEVLGAVALVLSRGEFAARKA